MLEALSKNGDITYVFEVTSSFSHPAKYIIVILICTFQNSKTNLNVFLKMK